MLSLIRNHEKFGWDYMYASIDDPLYTIVPFDQYSEVYGKYLQALNNYGVFYWPRITSVQRNQITAEENFNKMYHSNFCDHPKVL